MIALVNARGVPGAAAGLVRDGRGRRFLLSCHHVLFGRGAVAGDPVWAFDTDASRPLFAVGRLERGFVGRYTHRGEHIFIDCALAALDQLPPWARLEPPVETALARAGDRVWKFGPLSVAAGTVQAVDHYDNPVIEGRRWEAPGQLRLQPSGDDDLFTIPGESGAPILDEKRRLVGLLWGCRDGAGLACPAEVALAYLDVTIGPK